MSENFIEKDKSKRKKTQRIGTWIKLEYYEFEGT